jgi:hypothetical protein
MALVIVEVTKSLRIAIGIKAGPRPNVAVGNVFALRSRDVLLLRIAK